MDLFYREYGSGTPLTILHGFLGASGNWHTLSRKVFGEQYRVIVPPGGPGALAGDILIALCP